MIERPTFSEAVIGYRTFKLADWVLSPVSFGHPWRPGINKAVCKRSEMSSFFATSWSFNGIPIEAPEPPKPHAAPHQNCTCGYHGYHDIPSNPDDMYGGTVIGAIAAWGDLQVHSNGFRAEHAQIVALVSAPGLEEVAALYGVPLVSRADLQAEASQHGTPLPESMRPGPPEPLGEITGAGYVSGGLMTSAFAQSLYASSSSYFWTTPAVPRISNSALWTPADDKGDAIEDALDKFMARYAKPSANRQGPAKPKLGRGR